MIFDKEVLGSIPKELIVISTPAIVIETKLGKETFKPSIAIDANNENLIKKIKKNYRFSGQGSTEKKIKNNEINSLKLIDVVSRNNGGFDYFVSDKEGHLFDIRPDVLASAIIDSGVKKGGYLNGKYIWTTLYNVPTLVKVDSDIHKAIKRAHNRKDSPRIDLSKLEYGNIYLNRAGKKFVYLGKVNTIDMNIKEKVSDLKNKKYKNKMLFFSARYLHKDNIKDIMNNNIHYMNFSNFMLTNNICLVEDYGKLNLQKDLVSSIRKAALSNASSNKNLLAFRCSLAHMYKEDEQLPKIPEYVKFLTLA